MGLKNRQQYVAPDKSPSQMQALPERVSQNYLPATWVQRSSLPPLAPETDICILGADDDDWVIRREDAKICESEGATLGATSGSATSSSSGPKPRYSQKGKKRGSYKKSEAQFKKEIRNAALRRARKAPPV